MVAAVGEEPDGAVAPARGYRLRRRLWLFGPLALFAALRVPAFLEPYWYTDEAGYVTSARALLRGRVLYSQIWTNKPPLHLWTVAAVIRLLGTSEAALHVLPLLSGFATLFAVAYAGERLLGRRRTVVALLLAAILLGTPLFDAELLLPESLLIAPLTWAGALLLTRVTVPDSRRWPIWPVGVGALVAVAIAYQQTALAEACAFGLILAIVGAASWRRVAVYAGTVTVLTALWLVPSIVTAGAGTVAYALVGFWFDFAQWHLSSGTAGSWLHLGLPLLAVLMVVGAAWIHRRDRNLAWALWVWTVAALMVPAMARAAYPHYLVPSIAPAALALSGIRLRWPARTRLHERVAGAGLVLAAVLAGALAAVAGVEWPLVNVGEVDHTLGYYYGGALSTLTRGESLTAYQQNFDYRVPEDRAVATWISAHGLDGTPAVVWSSDTWLYDLDDLQLLLPTPPIYNDAVLAGSDEQLAQEVAGLAPEIVVTEGESVTALPEITSVLDNGYQAVDQSGTEIVWLRGDLVASVMGSTGLG